MRTLKQSGNTDAWLMKELLDLDRYPLDQPARTGSLIQWCKRRLDEQGLFNLDGLVRPGALARILEPLDPLFATDAFTHSREHNIYFSDRVTVTTTPAAVTDP